MIIANPIADTTFKMVMENPKAAKTLISTILDCEILSLTQANVERNFENIETRLLNVQRLDYNAEIVTEEEGPKKVMIEVQKTSNRGDLKRFRRYLGLEYFKTSLPLITIYILGFDIDIDAPIAMTPPYCLNVLTKEIIHTTEEYYKLLNHTAYFIQTKRIEANDKTLLDQLLTLFRQNDFIDPANTLKEFNIIEIHPKLKDIVDILAYIAADTELRDKLLKEQESAQFFEDCYEPYKIALVEKDLVIAEKDKAIEQAQEEKMKVLLEKDKVLVNTVQLLKHNGVSLQEISEATGLDISEIEQM